jgi:hypothetical protein
VIELANYLAHDCGRERERGKDESWLGCRGVPPGNPFPFLFSLLFLKQNKNPNDDEETRRKWRKEKGTLPFSFPSLPTFEI